MAKLGLLKRSRSTDSGKLTPRSAATRARIIAIAERLFAERGIEGVSLNDINKAAGQRNKNCTHYHFGSKEGLIQAILDKHEPSIAQRRNQMLDEYEARGELTLQNLIRTMLYPLAEKLSDPDGGREFLRFSSHLVVSHTMAALELGNSQFHFTAVDRLTNAIRAVTPHLSNALQLQRGILIGVMLMNGLAEHSRLLERCPKQDAPLLTRLFVANMEDCLMAVLMAPVSPKTAETQAIVRTG
jgi:AcrR family transcriptional regulator